MAAMHVRQEGGLPHQALRLADSTSPGPGQVPVARFSGSRVIVRCMPASRALL